ncbi:MAG: hypothetical protein AB1640_12275 [bacterium]
MEGKKEVLERMLAKGDTMLCINSRHESVLVPENHRGKVDLRLILNLNFRHPIEVLPDGVRADLLFGGVRFTCWIPYESLWAAFNPNTGEGTFWPAQAPDEVHHLFGRRRSSAGSRQKSLSGSEGRRTGPEPSDSPRGRPALRVIPGGKKE